MHLLADLIRDKITLDQYIEAEEKNLIFQALIKTKFNQARSASLLGIDHQRFLRKLIKYELLDRCREERANRRRQQS